MLFFFKWKVCWKLNSSTAKIVLYKSMRTTCAQPCIIPQLLSSKHHWACLLSGIWRRLLSFITMKQNGPHRVISVIISDLTFCFNNCWSKGPFTPRETKANVKATHFFDLCRSAIWTIDLNLTFAFVPSKRAFSNGFLSIKTFSQSKGLFTPS